MKFSCWPLAIFAFAASCGDVGEPTAFDWREDDRLEHLLDSNTPRGHFLGDTGDMLPVMVEKLATGGALVQNHYRGELASSGERVVVLIEDLIQQQGSSKNGTLVIGNCLGVIGLCDDPSAVRVARRMLGHPAESVRTAAIRAMAKLAEPEDYDSLLGLMTVVSGEPRRVLVQALGHADPMRLAGELSRWFDEDKEVALLALAARAVAASGAGERLGAASLDRPAAQHPDLLPFLAAALTVAGDPVAENLLHGLLVDDSPIVRTRALEAAHAASLNRALIPAVVGDSSETIRVLAAEAVAGLLPDEAALIALRAGTRDASPQVRQACLTVLLGAGDDVAAGIFLQLLQGGPSELGPAFRSMRGNWSAHPGIAETSCSILIDILDGMGDRPLKEREPWVQSLGQIPSAEASGWLLATARTAVGERHRMTAHRWLVLQSANGGEVGRSALMESWRGEESLERRLDYLWGASLSREPDTVQFLIEVVTSDVAPDHERLFAADCLTRQGSTPLVAPILKRACLGVTDPLVRPAFEELLWVWYS